MIPLFIDSFWTSDLFYSNIPLGFLRRLFLLIPLGFLSGIPLASSLRIFPEIPSETSLKIPSGIPLGILSNISPGTLSGILPGYSKELLSKFFQGLHQDSSIPSEIPSNLFLSYFPLTVSVTSPGLPIVDSFSVFYFSKITPRINLLRPPMILSMIIPDFPIHKKN